jgi:hypothetical protein
MELNLGGKNHSSLDPQLSDYLQFVNLGVVFGLKN